MPKPKNTSEAYKEFVKGLWKENPVFVQVLAMCPMLAVTTTAVNALVMGGATFFVLVGSSTLISLLRNVIPKPVRIATFIIVIATFVTVIDLTLKAGLPDAHKALGPFVQLIVVNCLILGRQEAFASRKSIKLAVTDAVGMGVGFLIALFALGAAREIVGSGKLLGIPLFGELFEPWKVMIQPPGGFLMLGLLLLMFNAITQRRTRKRAEREAARVAAEAAGERRAV